MFLFIGRIVLVLILSFSICMFGIFYCLLFYSNKSGHTAVVGHLFAYMAPIFGIKLEIRNFLNNKLPKTCIYIANHQNNYDMITVSYVVQPKTVTIGKKSLLWIPLFGQLYWLSGNILINKSRTIQRSRAILMKIIETIKLRNFSVWIFPEGTRNRGKKLLPFKTGAFYAAISAKVPIIPICVSNLSNKKIKLSRWTNGWVIIEVMPPITTDQCNLKQVRGMAAYCHKIMQLKIKNLNNEVRLRDDLVH